MRARVCFHVEKVRGGGVKKVTARNNNVVRTYLRHSHRIRPPFSSVNV